MSEYFPKTKSLGANVQVELDLSNYATKTSLKNATGVDTSDFVKKTDLVNLKANVDQFKNVPSGLNSFKCKVDKLHIGKLETIPANLSKLSNMVKMMLLEKLNMINWLKKLIILKFLILMI